MNGSLPMWLLVAAELQEPGFIKALAEDKIKVRPCRTCDRRATSHKLVDGYWVCQRCGRKTKAAVDYGE